MVSKCFLVFILIVLCAFFENSLAIAGPKHGKVVVCYISTWAVYRPLRGSFELEHIDPTLCTHLVYAFAGLNVTHDGIRSLDPWQDLKDDHGKGGFKRITDLKESYPHLKITIAIGGWNEGSTNYSNLVKDPVRRGRFVANTVDFVRKYNFDGLDLDWEYPGKRGGAPEDKLNFLLLVKELRSAFNKFNFLLTAAIGTGKETIDVAYDVQGLSYYLDYIHLMCYDYHGSWDQKTGVNAPLRSSDVLNLEFTVKYLLKMGASSEKLVLGIPLYGRTFLVADKLSASNFTKLGSLAKSVGFQGPFTREDGFMGYNEICSELQNATSGFKSYWDEESQTPFAISGEKVITYDNEKSIYEKLKLAMLNKLGGAMVWSMDTDDFRGDCGTENFPLMRSINRNIEKILQEIKHDEENVIHHGDHSNDKKTDGGGVGKISGNFIVILAVILMTSVMTQ